MRTRIWHSDWKPRWLIRCVSAALLSFMDKQENLKQVKFGRSMQCHTGLFGSLKQSSKHIDKMLTENALIIFQIPLMKVVDQSANSSG